MDSFYEILSDLAKNCLTKSMEQLIEKLKEQPRKRNVVTKDIFAAVVDAKCIHCNAVKDYFEGHIDNSKEVGAILLMAVRINSSKRIYVKNFITVFTPVNMRSQHFVGEYVSNEITYLEENGCTEKRVVVSATDDFFTTLTIEDSNKIYIFPLVFSELKAANIDNFADVQLVFLDQADNLYRVKISLDSLRNRRYIEQRVKIEK